MTAAAELARIEAEVEAAMLAWQSAEGADRVQAFHWLETVGQMLAEARKRAMVAKILSEEQGR